MVRRAACLHPAREGLSSTPPATYPSLQFLRRRRAQPTQLLQALPPLAPLAPPVLPSSQPAPGVDLNVDYQTEVAPFLGRCLVSSWAGAACFACPASAVFGYAVV